MRRLATAPRAMLRLSLITTVLAHAAGYARVPRHMLHAPRLAPCISCVTKDTLLLESSDSHSLASNPLDSSSQPPPAWRGSDGRRGGGISSSLACWGTPLALGERATSGPRAMRWRSRSSASPRMVLDSTLVAATIGGIFAGGLHAVTGPDHLAALLPLCMGRRWWVALYTGAYWGLGHGIGAALVGALAFAVRGALNLNALSRYMEAAVGISIIIIGANGIREAREWNTDHEGPTEVAKQHSLEVAMNQRPREVGLPATLGTGILHGCSGSGHLLGVMPALAMPSWSIAFTYLLTFGLGTMLAMSIFTAVVGELSSQMSERLQDPSTPGRLALASSLFALIMGTVWTGRALFSFIPRRIALAL